MIRCAFFAAGLLAAAAPVVAPGRAAAAVQKYPPVSCVYGGVLKLDRARLVALVRNGLNPTTNEEKAMRLRIGGILQNCVKRYGWGEKRKDLALQYMAGRILRSNAVYQLKQYDVTYEQFDAALAALTPEQRAAFRGGQISDTLYRAASAPMIAGGAKLAGLEGEALQSAARWVGEGIQFSITAEEAEKAY